MMSMDEVQKQAADAMERLIEAVQENGKSTNDKLDVIHTLVNSNMTAAMQSDLDTTVINLALMNEIIDLKKKDGKPPTKTALAAVQATKLKIKQLKAKLAERAKHTKTAEAQERAQKK